MQIKNNDHLQNTVFDKALEPNPNDQVLDGISKAKTDNRIYFSLSIKPVPAPEQYKNIN